MDVEGPYNEVVADTKVQAEAWGRITYGQTQPVAVKVGRSKDGRNSYRVYDLADKRVRTTDWNE
jgi:hypothetical protein